jgi:hypothetical protein
MLTYAEEQSKADGNALKEAKACLKAVEEQAAQVPLC